LARRISPKENITEFKAMVDQLRNELNALETEEEALSAIKPPPARPKTLPEGLPSTSELLALLRVLEPEAGVSISSRTLTTVDHDSHSPKLAGSTILQPVPTFALGLSNYHRVQTEDSDSDSARSLETPKISLNLYSFEQRDPKGLFWIEESLPTSDRHFLEQAKVLTKGIQVAIRLPKKNLGVRASDNLFVPKPIGVPGLLRLDPLGYRLEVLKGMETYKGASDRSRERLVSVDVFMLKKVLVSQDTKMVKFPAPKNFIFEVSVLLTDKRRLDFTLSNCDEFKKLHSGLEGLVILRDLLIQIHPEGGNPN
jgi:hypothetical protein